MKEMPRMMKCEDVLARLWELLDGELPPRDDAAVRRHLELCSRCYPRYDFLRAWFEYARRIRDDERAPPALRRRLFQAMLEQEATRGDPL